MLARVAGLGDCPRALGLPRAFIIPPHRVRLGARRAPSWRVCALYSARLHTPLALSTRRAPLSVRRRAYPPSAAIVRPSARCSRRGHGLRHRPGLSAGGAHSARARHGLGFGLHGLLGHTLGTPSAHSQDTLGTTSKHSQNKPCTTK